jgi:hypothetical protein
MHAFMESPTEILDTSRKDRPSETDLRFEETKEEFMPQSDRSTGSKEKSKKEVEQAPVLLVAEASSINHDETASPVPNAPTEILHSHDENAPVNMGVSSERDHSNKANDH